MRHGSRVRHLEPMHRVPRARMCDVHEELPGMQGDLVPCLHPRLFRVLLGRVRHLLCGVRILRDPGHVPEARCRVRGMWLPDVRGVLRDVPELRRGRVPRLLRGLSREARATVPVGLTPAQGAPPRSRSRTQPLAAPARAPGRCPLHERTCGSVPPGAPKSPLVVREFRGGHPSWAWRASPPWAVPSDPSRGNRSPASTSPRRP